MLVLFTYWTAALLVVTAVTYGAAAAYRRRPLVYVPKQTFPELASLTARQTLVRCCVESTVVDGGVTFYRQRGPGAILLVPGPESVVIHRPAAGAQEWRGSATTLAAFGAGAEVWSGAPQTRAVHHFETGGPNAVARLRRLDRFTWEASGFLVPPPDHLVDLARVDRLFVRYTLAIAAALAALAYYLET